MYRRLQDGCACKIQCTCNCHRSCMYLLLLEKAKMSKICEEKCVYIFFYWKCKKVEQEQILPLRELKTFDSRTGLNSSMFGSAWLGVFSNGTDGLEPNLVWNRNEALNYTNWDAGSEALLNGTNNVTAPGNPVCVYGDVINDFKWAMSSCDDKREFGCEIGNGNQLH